MLPAAARRKKTSPGGKVARQKPGRMRNGENFRNAPVQIRRINCRQGKLASPLWGRCPVRAQVQYDSLLPCLARFRSCCKSGRPMAAPTVKDAPKPSPRGEGGPANAGSDEVSAPKGACPKDNGKRIAPQAFPTVPQSLRSFAMTV